MAFTTFETSSELGEPTTLFQFTNGNDEWLYTDHSDPITHDGKVYETSPTKAPTITTSGDTTRVQVKVEVALTSGIAQLMSGTPPSKSVSLLMKVGHLSDPDAEFVATWSGTVLGGTRNGSTMALTCDNIGSTVRDIGLTRTYQLSCPYQLYLDGYCDADKASATVATAPIAITGNVLTLPTGWRVPHDLALYVHGVVEWVGGNGTEYRAIASVSGADDITLKGLSHDIEVTQSISVSLGCDRLTSGCNLHNNIVNYGGQEGIPLENPVGRNIF